MINKFEVLEALWVILRLGLGRALVSPITKTARNLLRVFVEPPPHLLVGPSPLEGGGVEPIILRPRRRHGLDVLPPARPRAPLQVAALKSLGEQLPLVQPRGLGGRQPVRLPPRTLVEVVARPPDAVARPAIRDEVHPRRPRCARRTCRHAPR
jgi:hypothetical protein